MKASELVSLLQEGIRQYGDVDVVTEVTFEDDKIVHITGLYTLHTSTPFRGTALCMDYTLFDGTPFDELGVERGDEITLPEQSPQ